MRKIGVVTATRAEFGLLKPLIQKLSNEDIFEVSVLVTGAHLSEEFGYTYKEIEEAGIPIAAKIECLTGDDSSAGITQVMAKAMTGFADYFAKNHLDLLIVLGDRYETMAVCIAAMNAGVPIAHIHGGETTEGAIDEAIRHSITKMSLLHFTATDIYRKRVIQLGEDPKVSGNAQVYLSSEMLMNISKKIYCPLLNLNKKMKLISNKGIINFKNL